jgi:hypothetical protein
MAVFELYVQHYIKLKQGLPVGKSGAGICCISCAVLMSGWSTSARSAATTVKPDLSNQAYLWGSLALGCAASAALC